MLVEIASEIDGIRLDSCGEIVGVEDVRATGVAVTGSWVTQTSLIGVPRSGSGGAPDAVANAASTISVR
jgi:hypothetical protein